MLLSTLYFSVLFIPVVVSSPIEPQGILEPYSHSANCHHGSAEHIYPPALQGFKGVVTNEPVGNNKSGSSFSLMPKGIWIPVKSIEAYTGPVPGEEKPKVIGIKVQWYDRSVASTGSLTGQPLVYDFAEAELISKFWILAGKYVNSFFFFAEQGKYRSGGSAGDKTYKLDVGSGWLVGFEGTSDDVGIYSLGATFQESSKSVL